MKKIRITLLCVVMTIGLAGCGSNSTATSSSTSTGYASTSSSEPTATAEEAHTYTEGDVNATITKCAPLSENGADIIDDITSPTKVLSLVSFTARGKGVVSDVFECAFDSLDIPDELIQQINTDSNGEQETTVGNLNVLWENDGNEIYVYMSTESLHQ